MAGPLSGRRIVVTRSEEQASGIQAQLTALGAVPVVFPTIQFAPLSSPQIDAAIRDLHHYDWLILTSANAVRFFWQALQSQAFEGNLPPIAVSGSATATALTELTGLQPTLVPEQYVAGSLVDGLGILEGKRVLLPRSRIGGTEIVELLAARGAGVDDVALYDTVVATPAAEALNELRAGFDVVTFASPSSVRNFLAILASNAISRTLLDESVVACVGPVTAEAVRQEGYTVRVVAEPHTMAGLVQKLAEYYEMRQHS